MTDLQLFPPEWITPPYLGSQTIQLMKKCNNYIENPNNFGTEFHTYLLNYVITVYDNCLLLQDLNDRLFYIYKCLQIYENI